MKIQINPRHNGACPICRFDKKCLIQKRLNESVKDFSNSDQMELVIYSCPKFEENA